MVGSSMHQRCLVLAVAFQWVVQVLSILRHGKNMPRRWLTIVPWSGGEQYTFGCPFWVFFPRPGQRHILSSGFLHSDFFVPRRLGRGTTQGIHPVLQTFFFKLSWGLFLASGWFGALGRVVDFARVGIVNENTASGHKRVEGLSKFWKRTQKKSVLFKVLHNRLLRYMLYTCPNLW